MAVKKEAKEATRKYVVFYARLRDKELAKKIYSVAYAQDQTINEILEQAIAFAFGHPKFQVKPRDHTYVDKALEAKERRKTRYKQLAGL